ncbi:MAG: PEP-CTERM sorting domain-containing protein, partial [Opitutales bacterium]|nr:PEP-CTERM sorting domain-containing protein [Opitutales bacterium]
NATGTLTIEGTNFTSLADSKIEVGSLSITATNANLAGTVVVSDKMSNGYGVDYNSSASITAGNFWTGENSNVLLNGSIKITSTASSDAFVVYKGSTLTFDESATLDLNGNARIEVKTNSTLIAKSAEKSIQTRHLLLSNGARIELHTKEVFADNKGGDTTVLVTTDGTSITVYAKETNSFGQTAIAGNIKLYLELDFASSDSYIDLGEIYATKNGNNLNLYVKNFENNRIKADSLRSGMGSTYLYLFDEASQKYVLNENAQWLGDATNGYWLTVAVPEPAEWAMILGALALGFAIYRKRK